MMEEDDGVIGPTPPLSPVLASTQNTNGLVSWLPLGKRKASSSDDGKSKKVRKKSNRKKLIDFEDWSDDGDDFTNSSKKSAPPAKRKQKENNKKSAASDSSSASAAAAATVDGLPGESASPVFQRVVRKRTASSTITRAGQNHAGEPPLVPGGWGSGLPGGGGSGLPGGGSLANTHTTSSALTTTSAPAPVITPPDDPGEELAGLGMISDDVLASISLPGIAGGGATFRTSTPQTARFQGPRAKVATVTRLETGGFVSASSLLHTADSLPSSTGTTPGSGSSVDSSITWFSGASPVTSPPAAGERRGAVGARRRQRARSRRAAALTTAAAAAAAAGTAPSPSPGRSPRRPAALSPPTIPFHRRPHDLSDTQPPASNSGSPTVSTTSLPNQSPGGNQSDDEVVFIDYITPNQTPSVTSHVDVTSVTSHVDVTSSTQANNQLADDEAFARQLQEQFWREANGAGGSSGNLVPPTVLTAPAPEPSSRSPRGHGRPTAERPRAPRRRARTADRGNHDSAMLGRIGSLSEYEWQVNRSSFYNTALPPCPPDETRPPQDIIDPEIIEYMRQHRQSTQGPAQPRVEARRVPPAARREANARLRDANRERDDMLRRIGNLSEYEWSVYEALYHQRALPPSPDPENHRSFEAFFDPGILNFMVEQRALRGRTRPPPTPPPRVQAPPRNTRTTQSDGARELLNLLGADDAIADLHEVLAGAQRRTGRQARAAAVPNPRQRRGRGPVRDDFAEMLGFGGILNADPARFYEMNLALADAIGDARPPGLTPSQIGRLPTHPFKGTESDQSHTKSCTICFSEYEMEDKLRTLTCFHQFHAECVDPWLKGNTTCPICREEVKFE